ncbi:MAG: glycoside hydrolase family 31 protein [Chitinophagaceae bacterium]|nr:glycoside hydrolase family 31 protein [Chitinophagaceae bacterium]
MKRYLVSVSAKFSLAIISLLLTANGALCQQGRLSEQIGNVKSVAAIPHGMVFTMDNAYAEITTYGPAIVRIRISREIPLKDFSFAIDDLSTAYSFKSTEPLNDQTVLTTDSMKVVVQHNPFRLTFYNAHGKMICGDDKELGVSWWGNHVSCYRQLHPDEKFIGLGEKTGDINRRGQYYQNWNSDVPAYALNQDPLYATIPFFIGIHDDICYGTFFDNTHHSYFNFGGGADEELYHFGADDGEMNYYVFGASTIENILKDYTSLTGRTPLPPIWSLGYQQCRWGYANSNDLLNIAKTLREKKMPADVVYMDITYMDHYKVFTWDPINFPDPGAMVRELKKMNFDLITIIDPGIKVEKGYRAYEEGVAQNNFVKYPDGHLYIGSVWPGRCHFPDFTKVSTRKWWGNNFKASHTDIGIRGFWNDMNEPAAWGREFPNLVQFGEGDNKATLFTVKNAYGLLMARATYEGTKSLMNGQRPFVLTRASYSGIQKFSAQWTGDNVASDEHMLLGQRLLNSMGVSGIPYVGMDVGGFVGDATAALYVRWMNLAIYSPLFRNHSEINSRSHEPWLFGEENTNFIRSLLEQRYKLLPYLYSTFYTAHNSGMPVNRMLPIFYTYDENVYNNKYGNQYMFGDNLLVCPVDSKTFATEIYLPGKGTKWYRLSNDEMYDGGQSHLVASPLNDLPVFVKEGGIVPMQSVVQSTKEAGDGILYIHVWKGNAVNNFTWYEDDGNTFGYEKNIFSKRIISYQPVNNIINIGKTEGSYDSKYKKIKLILHGFTERVSGNINNKTVVPMKDGRNTVFEFSNSTAELVVNLK